MFALSPRPVLAATIQDAAKSGDIAALKQLIAAGANVNAKDQYGGTALMYAAIHDNAAAVDLLLNNHADINATTGDGVTALELAAHYGDAQAARQLVTRGANVNLRAGDGSTALHQAARGGSLEIIRLLVEHGANLNAAEHEGFTPLQYAAAKGATPIVDYLLTKGANPNAMNHSVRPPHSALGLAAWNRYTNETDYRAVIKSLLHHGARDQWLSAVPGFDPYGVQGLMLSESTGGEIMVGRMPFILAQHYAARPWRGPGKGRSGGENFFVWQAPPKGDKSVTLVVIKDQRNNATMADAVLPAFMGKEGVIYREGVSSVAKDGPFVKLVVDLHRKGGHAEAIAGEHVEVASPGGSVDLVTGGDGSVSYVLRHVTINEPVTVTLKPNGAAAKTVDFDCVIRGATEDSVRMVINRAG